MICLFQFFVVFQHSHHVSFSVAERGDIRCVDIREHIDEVLASFRKLRTVHTFLSGEAFYISFDVHTAHILLKGASLIAGIIEGLTFLICSVEVVDGKTAFCELAVEGSVLIIEIEVAVSVTLRHHNKLTFREIEIIVERRLNIFVRSLAHEEFSLSITRVCHVDITSVLMAVERDDGDFLRVSRGEDSRDIAIDIKRHVQCLNLSCFEVVAECGDFSVVFPRLWIFESIIAWIELVFTHLWCRSHEILEFKGLHVGLIRPHPCQHFGVSRESIRRVVLKLLLIHPVGLSIDNMVELAIGGHLRFLPSIFQVHIEKVVLPDECHFLAVW